MAKGRLRIQCFLGDDYIPVDKCKISVSKSSDSDDFIEVGKKYKLITDDIGLTEEIELNAPSIQYSLNENSDKLPYSLYDIKVERNGFEELIIRGCQIFPEQVAYQRCNLNDNGTTISNNYYNDTTDNTSNNMNSNIGSNMSNNTGSNMNSNTNMNNANMGNNTNVNTNINNQDLFNNQNNINTLPSSSSSDIINILPNTLNGDYPAKIPEAVDKPLPKPTSGVVLAQPVIPEYIVVHQGSPNDSSAPNYKVPYDQYIKNVASCEIYSTWPETTIRANIFCIISFTLNRIYTEWYRGKGKNFDITSSTAYDHAFNYGRNIYDSISRIVDEIFSTYVRRIGKKQPLLTQYCDGKNVNCPEWLSQWGSKYLGDQGKLPYEILRYYYGDDIELVTAEKVEGIPQSYPGYDLTVGSEGESVRMLQEQLNRISRNYPLIPKIAESGEMDQNTAEAVKVFQGVFNLPKTGVVDYATWYKISDVYVGVSKIAELRYEKRNGVFIPPTIPNFGEDIEVPRFYY